MAYYGANGLEQVLLQHLRGLADNDGYVTFSERAFALDRGVSNTTIHNTIKRLQDQGKLEYTNVGKKGTLVHLLKSEQPKDNLRKCPKCGETAHDANSRFCHRCGTCLLSWDEQLKIKIDSLLPKIYREINDSKLSSELSEVMAILTKKVFKEEA